MIIYIIISIISIFLGIWIGFRADYLYQLIGGICLAFCGMCLTSIGALIALFGIFITANPTTTYYLEAEPLAYNYEANLTYFTSTEGQFKTEGIYPENTYLLTMDNNGTSDKEDDVVLVVWEPSEGEVG